VCVCVCVCVWLCVLIFQRYDNLLLSKFENKVPRRIFGYEE